MTLRRRLSGFCFCLLLWPTMLLAEDLPSFRFITDILADDAKEALKAPTGLATKEQMLVISDTGNGRLLKFTLKDDRVADGTVLAVPAVTRPGKLLFTSKGDLVVFDEKTRKLFRVDSAKGGASEIKLAVGEDAKITSFAIGTDDTLFVLDAVGPRLLVATLDGAIQKELRAGLEKTVAMDVAVTLGGQPLVVTAAPAKVLASTATGAFEPLTTDLSEHLAFPGHLTVDARGIIYVTDQNGSGIVMLRSNGEFVGRRLVWGRKAGLLDYPMQVAVSDLGIFVAERGNQRVQWFESYR